MAGVLVHEWIATTGGSENVLEAMSRMYPDADVVCLWNDSADRFQPDRVHETWLSRTPLRKSKALALPFMPATWRALPNRAYDWALISSHLFAHHARFTGTGASFRRYVYVHTPARYIWNPELDERGNSFAVRALAAALKPLDRARARETHEFAANSTFVQARIARAWGVQSRVIHPPVEVEAIQDVDSWRGRLTGGDTAVMDSLPTDYVLGASRFIPYKRLDRVIRTGEMMGLPVVLAGKGPELARLRALGAAASVPVHIVPAPSHPLLYALYEGAALYVFPAVEDFGIMPVEAMAAGAPVLAQSFGGAAESVVPGRTGALASFESDTELRDAIDVALATDRANRREHARSFSASRFTREISSWIGS